MNIMVKHGNFVLLPSQRISICPKSTIETLEKCVKYVQNYQ